MQLLNKEQYKMTDSLMWQSHKWPHLELPPFLFNSTDKKIIA